MYIFGDLRINLFIFSYVRMILKWSPFRMYFHVIDIYLAEREKLLVKISYFLQTNFLYIPSSFFSVPFQTSFFIFVYNVRVFISFCCYLTISVVQIRFKDNLIVNLFLVELVFFPFDAVVVFPIDMGSDFAMHEHQCFGILNLIVEWGMSYAAMISIQVFTVDFRL